MPKYIYVYKNNNQIKYSIIIIDMSEHLKPETVSFHCHPPQLTVLFDVHSSFTSTDIILIGIAKLSQM